MAPPGNSPSEAISVDRNKMMMTGYQFGAALTQSKKTAHCLLFVIVVQGLRRFKIINLLIVILNSSRLLVSTVCWCCILIFWLEVRQEDQQPQQQQQKKLPRFLWFLWLAALLVVTRVHCCNVKPFESRLCNCNNYISDPLCFPFCVWHFKYSYILFQTHLQFNSTLLRWLSLRVLKFYLMSFHLLIYAIGILSNIVWESLECSSFVSRVRNATRNPLAASQINSLHFTTLSQGLPRPQRTRQHLVVVFLTGFRVVQTVKLYKYLL